MSLQSAVGNDASNSIRNKVVIKMMTTESRQSLSRTIIERIIPKRIKKVKLDEYKDASIVLRRYLASELANKEFEQHKERALTENHRAGFMR